MRTFAQDVRYGIRVSMNRPGFTVIAVMTLALGIGANTAIFSIVNSVLLRPLPFVEPDRLVTLGEQKANRQQESLASASGNFTDWKNQNQVFESMAAYFNWNYNLTGQEEPKRLEAKLVSADFFRVLGVTPQWGRSFTADDDQAGKDEVVILSHKLWQSRFGASREILNQPVHLNGSRFTVIGVLPAEFKFLDEETDVWLPMALTPRQMQERSGKYLKVIARLKPGTSIELARSEMSTIASQLEAQYPETNSDWGIVVVPLHEALVGKVESSLLILFAAVGFVLLIACANVANLLLARATTRKKELAIRAALGAGKGRIVRQLLTESMLLALAGGIAGCLLATWGSDALVALNPGKIPRLDETSIDWRVMGFALTISCLTAVIFGLLPALRASNPDLNDALKSESRAMHGGSRNRLRSLLVAAEIAVSLVLLIGAGLMMKSFVRLQNVDAGFDARNLLTLRVWLPAAKYSANNQQIAYFEEAVGRLSTMPGVQSAGAIQDLPLLHNRMMNSFKIEGEPAPPAGEEPDAAYRIITPDYFRTMNIPLLRGREFTALDNHTSPPVLLINQTMASRFWAESDPVGEQIRFGGADSPAYTIIGVVGDVKHMGLDAEEGPAFYQPLAQKPSWLRWMTLVVRTTGEPLELVPPVRRELLSLDPDQPLYEIATMEQLLSKSVAQPRFTSVIFGAFALLSLVLAAMGVYGVVAYIVTQRTKEIGIRLALGAQQFDVMKLVIGQGMAPAVVGILSGLAASFAFTRVLESMLFGVSPTDAPTYIAIAGILLGVALLACYLPARRAAKTDPLVALHGD